MAVLPQNSKNIALSSQQNQIAGAKKSPKGNFAAAHKGRRRTRWLAT
jgi:hypothetical protein